MLTHRIDMNIIYYHHMRVLCMNMNRIELN